MRQMGLVEPFDRLALFFKNMAFDKGSARNKLDNLGSKCAPYLVAPD